MPYFRTGRTVFLKTVFLEAPGNTVSFFKKYCLFPVYLSRCPNYNFKKRLTSLPFGYPLEKMGFIHFSLRLGFRVSLCSRKGVSSKEEDRGMRG